MADNSPLSRHGMGADPWAWRSNMDATNLLAPQATVTQGPMPTMWDRVHDRAYEALGGTPDQRPWARAAANAFELGTLGMASGAYDGGRELAETGRPGALAMAMLPGMKPVGAAAKAAAPAAREAVQGIRAYHGTPHDFDQFSMSKIGTGEGAQAYGHGLYMAESEGVAKSYRDALSGKPGPALFVKTGGGEKKYSIGRADPTYGTPEWTAANEVALARGDVDAAIKQASSDDVRGVLQKWKGEGAQLEIKKRASPGRMYEVNIKADPEHFLDWDKPLSQQSEKVRGAWNSYADTPEANEAAKNYFSYKPGMKLSDLPELSEANASTLYRAGPSADGVSKHFRDAGVPGIKYLDGSSRNGSTSKDAQGTSNYVVFDESLIQILRKYGLVPPAVAGAAASQPDPAQVN